MDNEIRKKVNTALNHGRCKHVKRIKEVDKEGNIVYLKCKRCGFELTCNTCRFGQFDGYRNTFYCIKKEEKRNSR